MDNVKKLLIRFGMISFDLSKEQITQEFDELILNGLLKRSEYGLYITEKGKYLFPFIKKQKESNHDLIRGGKIKND